MPPKEQQPPPATRASRLAFWKRPHGGFHPSRHVIDTSAAGQQELEILGALTDLRDMDVREVMTPRGDVVTISIPVLAEDVARAVRESGHSCFPVVDGDLDRLVGVLFINDLFRTKSRATIEHLPEPSQLEISRRLRQPFEVPESMGVLEALSEMRRQHRGFAVVIDEHGGVAGVLTVKDLLEPLVGELLDEFDEDEEPDFVPVDAARWLISGSASVDDVRERLSIELPDGEYVTLGGFLLDALGHIPEEGERLSFDDGAWEFRIVEMDKRRIAKVLAKRNEPNEQRSSGDTEAEQRGTSPEPGAKTPGPNGSSVGVPTAHQV
jgi:CBS domain containing-hemolysin-like protein